jgi:hypothetical protein
MFSPWQIVGIACPFVLILPLFSRIICRSASVDQFVVLEGARLEPLSERLYLDVIRRTARVHSSGGLLLLSSTNSTFFPI